MRVYFILAIVIGFYTCVYCKVENYIAKIKYSFQLLCRYCNYFSSHFTHIFQNNMIYPNFHSTIINSMDNSKFMLKYNETCYLSIYFTNGPCQAQTDLNYERYSCEVHLSYIPHSNNHTPEIKRYGYLNTTWRTWLQNIEQLQNMIFESLRAVRSP